MVPLTHDDQQHLPAADPGRLLHFALVGARVRRPEPRQVDGGVAVLGVSRVEVDSALHGLVVVLVGPVARVQDHLDVQRSKGWFELEMSAFSLDLMGEKFNDKIIYTYIQ